MSSTSKSATSQRQIHAADCRILQAAHEHDNVNSLQQIACAVLMRQNLYRSGLRSCILHVWLGRTKTMSWHSLAGRWSMYRHLSKLEVSNDKGQFQQTSCQQLQTRHTDCGGMI